MHKGWDLCWSQASCLTFGPCLVSIKDADKLGPRHMAAMWVQLAAHIIDITRLPVHLAWLALASADIYHISGQAGYPLAFFRIFPIVAQVDGA